MDGAQKQPSEIQVRYVSAATAPAMTCSAGYGSMSSARSAEPVGSCGSRMRASRKATPGANALAISARVTTAPATCDADMPSATSSAPTVPATVASHTPRNTARYSSMTATASIATTLVAAAAHSTAGPIHRPSGVRGGTRYPLSVAYGNAMSPRVSAAHRSPSAREHSVAPTTSVTVSAAATRIRPTKAGLSSSTYATPNTIVQTSRNRALVIESRQRSPRLRIPVARPSIRSSKWVGGSCASRGRRCSVSPSRTCRAAGVRSSSSGGLPRRCSTQSPSPVSARPRIRRPDRPGRLGRVTRCTSTGIRSASGTFSGNAISIVLCGATRTTRQTSTATSLLTLGLTSRGVVESDLDLGDAPPAEHGLRTAGG